MLEKDKNIKDIRTIKGAHVPIIKMRYYDIDIDLLFARLAFEIIEDNLNLNNDIVLKGCDEQTVYSINACRNNDMLLDLIPNLDVFKTTLKAIKTWAKARDVYSNKIGYLGGIAWTILTAKICQLYPNLLPNKLIEKFFFIFSKWNWKYPVLLCESKECKINIGSKNWSTSASGESNFMPIITLAFPTTNAAFNVSETTRRIVIKELGRAAKIASNINSLKAGYAWPTLFSEYDFFKAHFDYLRVDALSQGDHLIWEGFIESKLRVLVTNIDKSGKNIKGIRPSTKSFNLTDHYYRNCTTFLIGVKVVEGSTGDLKEPIHDFCEHLSGNKYGGVEEHNIRITHVTREKLPSEVFKGGIRPHYKKPLSEVPTQPLKRERPPTELPAPLAKRKKYI
jgi:poly(A) polymerase